MTAAPVEASTTGASAGAFDPDRPYRLSSSVSVRPESFGALVYEMVTGKKAFDGTSEVDPPLLDHVVAECLAKDPDARWQSAGDLKREPCSLTALVDRWRPRYLAVLGVTAYRTAFARPKATMGPQPDRIAGVPVWVLPNPSGLNAHYTAGTLAAAFAELRAAASP